MQTRNSNLNDTMATETSLNSGRSTLERREEIEKKQQASKDSYMKFSLELKQMEVDSQIEKVESSKCKLAEVEAELLKYVDEAELILSGVMTLNE